MARIKASELNLKERLVHVGRTAKVVKGGKRFGFSAIVVVGDGNGYIGVGLGKAREVSLAISKGTEDARKNIVKVSVLKGTVPHISIGKYGAASVMLKPASPGTGLIAGGGVRAVLESAGIHDILTKSHGSQNPHNIVKATLRALQTCNDPLSVARRRGMSLQELFAGGPLTSSDVQSPKLEISSN
ncbi:MAG: 30S ribosomal protein S5 [Ignavibacteriales bacterium]|nr:30S ribosomal protein S5 [Ignavibacteriales bacterium]